MSERLPVWGRLGVRWRKLLADVRAERGRVALMLVAVVVSLVAVGTVLGGYAILTREISVAYLGTNPADATLEIPGGVDEAVLAEARRDPDVVTAEARDVVLARVRVGEEWRPLLLFVAEDLPHVTLNRVYPERGAWPPSPGTALLERSARQVVGDVDALDVRLPGLRTRTLPVSGLAYDPGLAPAWQEREGYAYITPATLAALGGDPRLHELRVTFTGSDPEAAAQALAARLATAHVGEDAAGVPVHQIRVPAPHQHPHQRQMTSILTLLLVFAGLALVLSAVLVASSLAAMLARQVREIGVLKTVGATTGQVAGMYAVFVGALGAVASAVAWPIAVLGARGLATNIAGMLNFELSSLALPHTVPLVFVAAGVGVPLLLAVGPIRRASRATVRDALDAHGARPLPAFARGLPVVARDALRRPARLALTVGLLAMGGAMFLAALNMAASWDANTAKVVSTRHYDVEVRLHGPEPLAAAEAIRAVPGVRSVEPWGFAVGAFGRAGAVDVVRTWPDRGHGSLTVYGCPSDTRLVDFPVRAGRWLRPGDVDGVVLNQGAASQVPGVQPGARVTLSIDGALSEWTVVGLVEEIGSPGAAYLTDAAFSRVTATEGAARVWRVVLGDPDSGEAAVRRVDAALGAGAVGDVAVDAVVPLSELDAAVGEHVQILIRALLGLAAVMATVGALGLASAMGTAVLERTREIGVLRTLGATPERVRRRLVGEALFIAAVSGALGVALSLPLSALLDAVVGQLGFLAPLPFVVAPLPVVGWLIGVLVLAALATVLPAGRAARIAIPRALGEV